MKNKGKMSACHSRKVFRKGDKTQKVNISAAPMRGGIRL